MNKSLKNIHNKDKTIGVVGGGQLAQMLAIAAKKKGIDVIVQTPSRSDPAVSIAKDIVLCDTSDISGTLQLSEKCKTVVFENEWIDTDRLSSLEKQGISFVPSLKSIAPLVDKLSQRRLINKLNLPCPKWSLLSDCSIKDLKLPNTFKFPLMAKSSRGGYDGKGTKVIKDFSDLKKLFLSVDPEKWFLEKWIDYEKELSLVLSRNLDGEIRFFPLFETHQYNQVCDWVITPTDVSHPVSSMAYNIGASLLQELNYVGVLAIEFFYGKDGLLINEIAPRTHNSAHLTIEACHSSQFDQNISIAAGLPLLLTELKVPGALMINLLGINQTDNNLESKLEKLKKIKGATLHWYKKVNTIPGRKLGHLTIILDEIDFSNRRTVALQKIEHVRSIWPIRD